MYMCSYSDEQFLQTAGVESPYGPILPFPHPAGSKEGDKVGR